MKSQALGKNISGPEVVHISLHGIWLNVHDGEYFLSFKDYPWFQNATVNEIHNVRLSHSKHLYWPDLDVDLDLGILDHPERYPLVCRQI